MFIMSNTFYLFVLKESWFLPLPIVTLVISVAACLPKTTRQNLNSSVWALGILLGWVAVVTFVLNWPGLYTGGVANLIELQTVHGLFYNSPVPLGLGLAPIPTAFSGVTLFIGLTAIFYSFFYMEAEPLKHRFVMLLTAFMFSMLLLLLSTNVVTVFLGWELIGVFSFLLIGFWSIKATSVKASFKALAYNQLSDACLLGYIVLWFTAGSGYEVANHYSIMGSWTSVAQPALLIVCICCKSAQFPFFFWLPDSMEAPIPASALIHSATLVSAGVYLILALPLPLKNALFTDTLIVLGAFTVVLGGLTSILQNDLKKVLAFSTISNCGFMVLFAAMGESSLCFFYFMVHGLAKAFSFFIVGLVVLSLGHKQDWRVGTLSPHNKGILLSLLLPTIAFLGAWPTTFSSFVKYANINTLSLGYLAPVINASMLIGSLTSIIYSSKIIKLLTQKTPTKSKNQWLVTGRPQITNALVLLLLVVGVFLLTYTIGNGHTFSSQKKLVTHTPDYFRIAYNWLPATALVSLLVTHPNGSQTKKLAVLFFLIVTTLPPQYVV